MQAGRFELGDLVEALKNSGGAIKSANEDTRGFAEMWAETKNKVVLALEPLGKMFLAFAENWLPKIASVVEVVAGAFARLPGPAKAVLVVFGLLAAALGPVLIIVGKLILLAPAMGAAWTMLTGPIGLIALAIAALVVVGILVYKNWEKIKGWFVGLWTYIKTFFIAAWKTVESVFGGVIKTIVSWFSFLYNTLKTIALAIGGAVIGAFRWLRDSAVSIFQAVAEFVIDKLLWLMEQIAKIPIVKKFVKNLQEGLAAAKASIAESREKIKASTEGMADDTEAAGGKIGASYDAIGESAGQMKAVLSSVHAELVDVIKKGTLSEIEYARWAAEETYAVRKKAIEEEIADSRARNQELKLLAQAKGIELAALEKSFRDKELQGKIDFATRIKEQEQQMDLDRIEGLKTYAAQRQTIQNGINQMTMTALEFKLLMLDQERAREEAQIASSTALSATQKAELLAQLAAYYAMRRALGDADATAEVALAEATQAALTGVYASFVDNVLGAFQAFGEGTKTILGAVGSAFKGTINACISALKQLVVQELIAAAATILLKKSEAIARVIASVMALPFPLNLLAVGGAIAAVSALFSAIKLGEGGVVMGPTLALVGDKPEAVIPLSKLGMFTAGEGRSEGASFELNINSPLIQTTGLSRGQIDELAPYLFRSLEGEARRYGFSLKRG